MSIFSSIFGFGEKSEEEIYDEAMRKAKEVELEEERKAKIAEARAKAETETQAKMDAQRAQAEAGKIEREVIRTLPKEERRVAESELERRRTEERLATESSKLEAKKQLATMEYRTRQAKGQIKRLEQAEGIPEEALQSGFVGEYRKIIKLLRAGRGRTEDVQALRSLYAEATAYGIDENVLREITNLRRKIDGQSIAKKGAGAVEAIPRIGAKALVATGALVSGRAITIGEGGLRVAGRSGMVEGGVRQPVAGAQPVKASDVLGISPGAMRILGIPSRRPQNITGIPKTSI